MRHNASIMGTALWLLLGNGEDCESAVSPVKVDPPFRAMLWWGLGNVDVTKMVSLVLGVLDFVCLDGL